MAELIKSLMTGDEIAGTLRRVANEISDLPWAKADGAKLAVVGIQRRGATLGERFAKILAEKSGRAIEQGVLDITLYRDDLSTLGPQPMVNRTVVPFDVTGRNIILVDDVLYTGRTIRAALDVLAHMGRPKRVFLFPLVDRGLREYPIQPDIAGLKVDTTPEQSVRVKLQEFDQTEAIELWKL